MKCPHCDQPLPSVLCSECGSETPEKGAYCCQCGKAVKKEESESETSERTLCSDGTCIGTINEKGICNVCGKPSAESAK
jgi:hypothetical protein